jgi:hypothetical protein
MRVRYLWIVCFSFALSCSETTPRRQNAVLPTGVAMLRTTPAIDGYIYRCSEMVQVVNYLRQLGKDKSLALLREYLKSDLENAKVLIICRLLFVNPKGWAPPRLGAPVPVVCEVDAQNFPLFPIALSDKVPFLLVNGYRLGGVGEPASECLELCEGFSIIQSDYPLMGYEKAAKALAHNESFRKLYKEKDLPQMVEMILHQATEPEREGRKK